MTNYSQEQLQMLSEIFRIYVKEIATNNDKEHLGPGEIGIDYTNGSIVIRNPHTGELFYPNSVEFGNMISAKYDNTTGLLNADTLNGIPLFVDIEELNYSDSGITHRDIDAIIEALPDKAILMARVLDSMYELHNLPAEDGILTIYKIIDTNSTNIMISYYDSETCIKYDGKYNKYTHLFESWMITNSNIMNTECYDTQLGGMSAVIHYTETPEIDDMTSITVRITNQLSPGAKLTVNGIEAKDIYNPDGSLYMREIPANTVTTFIYDKEMDGWVIVPTTRSASSVITQLFKDRINSVIRFVETRFQENAVLPGRIITSSSVYTASTNNVTTIPYPTDYVAGIDKLMVNYAQTLLRQDVDYTLNENNLTLINNISLAAGDKIQFIVLKQPSN